MLNSETEEVYYWQFIADLFTMRREEFCAVL